MLDKISSAFTAGALGGLANSLAVWFFTTTGFAADVGVNLHLLHPSLTSSWLSPRLVWGGLWGFLFLIPVLKKSVLLRGLVFSIGPSLFMMFMAFPKMGYGVYGLSLGTLMPFLVILFNALWGIAAALWYSAGGE
ncbi:MAG: hypothetical protein ACM34I_04445 [bacterium]